MRREYYVFMNKKLSREQQIVPLEIIERRIYFLRGRKVMLDSDLAELYQVETKVLNQAVKRNQDRFPEDFMFRLRPEEAGSLRSRIVTSKAGRGGQRYLPYVFTEQGVAMLSSVLNSKRAIQVNIAIMRAFVQLRQILATNKDLATKLEAMEKKYDGRFRVVFAAIKQLMGPPSEEDKKEFGFKA